LDKQYPDKCSVN